MASVPSPSPYAALRESACVARGRLDDLSRRIARGRAVSFTAGAGAILWGLSSRMGPGASLVLAGAAALVLFAGLVVWHARVDDRRAFAEAHVAINERAIARIGRDWRAVPDEPSARADHPVAEDLDLFGHASVMQLLGPSTAWGRETLERWLLDPPHPAAVRSRQEAVAELAPLLEFRQTLAVRGLLGHGVASPRLGPLVDWAESEPWLLRRRWLVRLTRASSLATAVLIGAQGVGAIGASVWLLPLGLNVAVIAWRQLTVHALLDKASSGADALRQYAKLFQTISTTRFGSPALRRLQEALGGAQTPAHVELTRLDRIHDFANLRRSAAILHFPIHALTLWDFHVLERLEQWQRRAGPHVRGWLEALGEVDALCCLAGLRHDNPGWCVPEIAASGEAVVRASGLGHPLIAEDTRVVNDVEIGPTGTFLLVTGSNMSGKSTLLRAIGVNLLLAQAGGPVCATRLSLPPVIVETSMRVHDSLEEGVSYFMAALRRLRAIVESVRDAERAGGRVLYLLDEILQGTNTAERQTATRAIIRALLAHGAIGAVTTHDLGLVDEPELADVSRPVHFSEQIDEQDGAVAMRFDYRLEPGLATSRNALRLMRMIGLDPVAIKR